MKHNLFALLIMLLVVGPFTAHLTYAQNESSVSEDTQSTKARTSDENYNPLFYRHKPTLTESQKLEEELGVAFGESYQALINLQLAYGTEEDQSQEEDAIITESDDTQEETNAEDTTSASYNPGSAGRIKVKPSDKKRLIKIANGSLSEKQKKKIVYDQKLLDLLIHLTAPESLGGSDIKHLRIADFLRFRQDPRSRETENTDNISAHNYGKAADIVEINKTRCVLKTAGLFGVGGSEKPLPEFPVKVEWQGGAPRNPLPNELAEFDSVSRANALRDILGALPSTSYSGGIKGFTDLLQQLQRRVIAEELGLDRSSLDYPVNNDILDALGRAVVAQKLGFSPNALTSSSKEENLRSLARGPFEQSLQLPPRSFTGDTLKDSLETLGRHIIAYQNGINPQDIMEGKVDRVKNSSYYTYYRKASEAFDLPPGALEGVKNNDAAAFRAVGAQHLARKLKYSPSEVTEFVNQARSGSVTQLSLARYGGIPEFPTDMLLTMVAPSKSSSKKAGELAIAGQILTKKKDSPTNTLDEELMRELAIEFPSLKGAQTRERLIDSLLSGTTSKPFYRRVGASYMEKAFDLPEQSFVKAIAATATPSVEQYSVAIGPEVLQEGLGDTFSDDDLKLFPESQRKKLKSEPLHYYFNKKEHDSIIDKHLNLPSGTTKKHYSGQLGLQAYRNAVGKAYMENDFRDSFLDLYHTSSVGLATVDLNDMFSLVLGQVNDVSTRAGASWVEEDLGLVPDSFSVLFTQASAEERLVNAGVNVLAGHLFEAFDIDATGINDAQTLKKRLGKAKVETLFGLSPGTFQGSLDSIKQSNPRFDDIFASPDLLDGVLQVPQGTVAGFKNGRTSSDQLVTIIGDKLLANLEVESLHTKFGWDDRFKLVTQQQSSGRNQKKYLTDFVGTEFRQLLAKMGGYNLDFSFGYDPNTMSNWVELGSTQAQNQFLLEVGGQLYGQRLGFDKESRSDIFNSYREGNTLLRQRAITKLQEITKIPNLDDIEAFTDGDPRRGHASWVAAQQAEQSPLEFDNEYELFHTMILRWSNDAQYEQQLADQAINRYHGVLEDVALAKRHGVQALLPAGASRFKGLTLGAIGTDGKFNRNLSPYSDSAINVIKQDFFADYEAGGTYFYGTIDEAIRKKSGSIPENFSITLMEGSNKDRSDMIFSFLQTKVGDGILSSLPADLQPTVSAWLGNRDPIQGQLLAKNNDFTNWASQAFGQYTDTIIPASAMGLATFYTTGSLDEGVISEDPSSFLNLNPESMTGWINKQLGLNTGVFGDYYQEYREMQELYQGYQAGTVDQGQLLFAADALFLGGQLSEFTRSIDETLGLPAGSSQLLVQYAITQNPLYLAQFASNLFFGASTTIECPDLQKEAQKNVKLLLEAILDQGKDGARAIPSQVITYDQDYLTHLTEKIRKNYANCLAVENARCGMFARSEYVKQVHIGF